MKDRTFVDLIPKKMHVSFIIAEKNSFWLFKVNSVLLELELYRENRRKCCYSGMSLL